ncbi:hypothetical protein F511_43173 [Dorcoceras hygrometricum]|uniref:Uncharacterized protein n=1 Tax=Dorcoceras hygrometricum TaxID=472368 RepID=A0A2Z7A251_9LAMI|nr:hypothetical protein F511_43173 [Dorcoceras hygrometricum]
MNSRSLKMQEEDGIRRRCIEESESYVEQMIQMRNKFGVIEQRNQMLINWNDDVESAVAQTREEKGVWSAVEKMQAETEKIISVVTASEDEFSSNKMHSAVDELQAEDEQRQRENAFSSRTTETEDGYQQLNRSVSDIG